MVREFTAVCQRAHCLLSSQTFILHALFPCCNGIRWDAHTALYLFFLDPTKSSFSLNWIKMLPSMCWLKPLTEGINILNSVKPIVSVLAIMEFKPWMNQSYLLSEVISIYFIQCHKILLECSHSFSPALHFLNDYLLPRFHRVWKSTIFILPNIEYSIHDINTLYIIFAFVNQDSKIVVCLENLHPTLVE